MITIDQKANQIYAAVFGEFSLADFKEFEALERRMATFEGPVTLLVDLRQMASFTIDVVWEEVKFIQAHGNDFRRVAVVTDSQWVSWSAWLLRVFSHAESGVFADIEDAQSWLDQDPGSRTLVGVGELRAHADEWRIIDCRHDLTDPDFGARAYAEGHIPGALFLDIDGDLSGPKTGTNGRHPLPDVAKLARRLGECGIDANTQVVAYDQAGGMFAARLWWLLRWLGHDRVAVLDGCIQAWTRAGLPLSQDVPQVAKKKFVPEVRAGVVDASYVKAFLNTSEVFLLDARSADRFRGENETLDPVGGHIPGAQNRFFRNNLKDDGYFKAADDLRVEFASLLGETAPPQVIHSCGSGISACHNLLAMEIAGLPGSRFYAGSWSEWCSDPSRPVATGEA